MDVSADLGPRGVKAEENVVSLFPIKQNSKLFTTGQ